MNSKSKAEAEDSRLDGGKWLLVLLLVSAGVVGNAYFGNQSLLYRVIVLLVLAGVAAFIALQTARGAEFWKLVKEARIEIRKVVWPTRQEATQTTAMVFAFVLLTALILWGLDSLIGWLASRILGLG